MKFLLNHKYGLRGWLKMPRVLVDIENNHALKILSPEQFSILQNCDGEKDLQFNGILQEFLKQGIIVENLNNQKLKESQKYNIFFNRRFPIVQWAITGKCNYNCKHCFMAKDLENSSDEFSTKECLDIVNQIADCGFEEVYITGGEPLLRLDFFEIIDELIKRKISIEKVNTNGSLITKNFIKEIKNRNIYPTFMVSFDGIGCHDWMRGKNGAEKEAVDAIKLLVKEGFDVTVICCIHRGNIHALKDTIELMNSIGVNCFEVFRTAETLRWSLFPEENKSLSYKECYDIYMDLLYTHKKRNWNIEFYLQDFCWTDNKANVTQITPLRYAKSSDFSKDFVCPQVRNMIFIAPNGQVLPCNAYTGYALKNKWKFENVKDMKLKDILTQSAYLDCVLTTVKDLFEINKECKNCIYSKKCMGGRCRLVALENTGNFYGKDESACVFFKNNYEDKIKKFTQQTME